MDAAVGNVSPCAVRTVQNLFTLLVKVREDKVDPQPEFPKSPVDC